MCRACASAVAIVRQICVSCIMAEFETQWSINRICYTSFTFTFAQMWRFCNHFSYKIHLYLNFFECFQTVIGLVVRSNIHKLRWWVQFLPFGIRNICDSSFCLLMLSFTWPRLTNLVNLIICHITISLKDVNHQCWLDSNFCKNTSTISQGNSILLLCITRCSRFMLPLY